MTTTTTSTRRKKMMTIEDDDDDDIDIPILVSSLRLNQLELEQEDDETILSLICSRPTSFNKITIPDELSYTKDNEKSIYAATQSGQIIIFNFNLKSKLNNLSGHTGAILSLQLLIRSSSTTSTSTSTTELIQQNSNWLTSSSTDGTIRVWNLFTSEPLYLIHCPRDNIGDILSLLWVPTSTKGNGRLYAGCQDTSIMVRPSNQSTINRIIAHRTKLMYIVDRSSTTAILFNSFPTFTKSNLASIKD
jgi:WD40 repeat protein